MPRKIIQITATAHEDTDGPLSPYDCIFALCDDGTVWQITTHGDKWDLFPPVPQGDDP